MKKTTYLFWPFRPDVNSLRFLVSVRILALLLVLGLALPAWSLAPENLVAADQQITVTGTISDAESGMAMPGVNIQVKGTSLGAISDGDGKFTLMVPDRNATLVFSFIGYVAQDIPIAGRSVVNVELKAELTGLDEVVVVGYSTQKRANVIGSVTSISGTAIQGVPAPSVANALSGRLPGTVVITPTGEPGQDVNARIMVRGRSTLSGTRATDNSRAYPLIIIDGVPGRSLTEIDPMDIASLSVLKDASAAIYGAQAANGVILITTKKGQEGAPRLNYQFYQGFMTPTIIPDVTNAAEYATMLSEYQVAKGAARTYSDADIALFKSGEDPWRHPDTDWYNDLIKKWTTTFRHNVTVDGGARGMNYYVSMGVKGDESFYKQSTTSYRQYNLRAKLDLPITDWLRTTVETAGFIVSREYPYKSADAIVGQSTRLTPTTWSFWPDGKPGPDIEYGDNPVVTSTWAGGKDDQKTYRNLNTFSATITPPFIKGLSLNGSFSYDLTNFYRKRFFQPWVLYYPNWSQATIGSNGFITSMPLTPTLRGLSSPENGENFERRINQTLNASASYTKKFGDHNLTVFGGFEQYQTNANDFYGYRKYYISTLIQTMSAGADLDKNTTGGMSLYARKSLIGRVTYDYKGKYLAEFLFRRDGSLKFPPDSRWGNFPGLLLGWRASEEDFWKNSLPFINFFKLKASYGKMGMDPGNAFQYMNSFGLSSGMVFGTGTAIETAVGPPTVANPIITWETQTTYNGGFESKFLKDLFSLNFDYFYNRREDILASRDASVPNFSGLTLPSENIAIVDNKGFELELGFHKNLTSDLRLDISGNYAFNHNEVVFQDEPKRAVEWQQTTGHSYGAWLMYDCIGVFKDDTYTVNGVANYPRWANAKPGDLIFRDVSGDGLITGDDRILIDNVDYPETTYGVNLDLTWKDLTLSVLIQGQGKFLRQNIYDERRGEAGNYMQWTYDNRWTPTNTETNIARAYNRNDYYWAFSVNMSDYWLDNTAFCRLKNAVLTYNIPSQLYKSLGISRASVYFTGNNLALLYSATRKWDPEANGPGVYPTMKTFAFGANISF
jgi:TonB-linked SusC/RagA family outer membrane protein